MRLMFMDGITLFKWVSNVIKKTAVNFTAVFYLYLIFMFLVPDIVSPFFDHCLHVIG